MENQEEVGRSITKQGIRAIRLVLTTIKNRVYMNIWKVSGILAGNRISVVPDWAWNEKSGHEIVILGYTVSVDNLPDNFAEQLAVNRLNKILLNKDITLKNPREVDADNNLHCEVYLDDVNICKYFADFKN